MSVAAERLRGSCLCGAVAFVLTTPPIVISNCHCIMCRKHHGAAYATFLRIARDGFEILRGADQIRTYASSPGAERRFCATCGAKLLFVLHAYPSLLWVVVGALDDEPRLRPKYHIFAASKAPWFEIHDSLPQHAAFPDDLP